MFSIARPARKTSSHIKRWRWWCSTAAGLHELTETQVLALLITEIKENFNKTLLFTCAACLRYNCSRTTNNWPSRSPGGKAFLGPGVKCLMPNDTAVLSAFPVRWNLARLRNARRNTRRKYGRLRDRLDEPIAGKRERTLLCSHSDHLQV